MKDLVTLVNYYIKENHLPKVAECSYDKKYSLLDIANLINNLSKHKVSIKQLDPTEGNSYIGKTSLQLNYVGLEKGIQEVYNKIK
jgi:hypothetical protein